MQTDTFVQDLETLSLVFTTRDRQRNMLGEEKY